MLKRRQAWITEMVEYLSIWERSYIILFIPLLSKVLNAEQKTRLVQNIAGHLSKAQEFIQKRAVRNFSQADPEYGRRIQEILDKTKSAPQVSEIS